MKTFVSESTIEVIEADRKPPSRSFSSFLPDFLKSGWKTTVGLGFCAAAFVCVVNLILLAWTLGGSHDAWSDLLSKYPGDGAEGIKTVYTGSCDTAASISTWVHLAINILSSLLLAASNGAMQVLAAPSRSEVDVAHARRRWLDIGVQSWRNLGSITWTRRLIWMLLAVTTVPLHLLYNSVVLKATSMNNFLLVAADQKFVDGVQWNTTRSQCFEEAYDNPNKAIRFLQDKIQHLERLDNAECIAAYGGSMVTNYANLLVIANTSYDQAVDPLLRVSSMYGTQGPSWICESTTNIGKYCSVPRKIDNAQDWTTMGTTSLGWDDLTDYCSVYPNTDYAVEYCLAQRTPEMCSIGVAVSILIAVLICNVIKVCCLFWTWRMLSLDPLVTIGDAVASFLGQPDPTTEGCGALEARSQAWKENKPAPKRWEGRSRIGFQAASATRWSISSFLFVLFWVICLVLLELGLRSLDNTDGMSANLSRLIKNGIGNANNAGRVDLGAWRMNFAPLVLIANLPQLLISLLYILYNDLFTRMSLCREWVAFSRSPQRLRVSRPSGSQLGTHFLSLPWKLAVPLMVVMMILHWLVSQSIFLIYITGYDYTVWGAYPFPMGAVFLWLGWSALALILSLLVGGILILALWISGFVFRYGSTMPLAQGCSVAISAACHPPRSDTSAAVEPLMYGVVRDSHTREGQPQHVTFTSRAVQQLQPGNEYY